MKWCSAQNLKNTHKFGIDPQKMIKEAIANNENYVNAY